MITEKFDPYILFIQGFRNTEVIDPEKVLKDLRTAFPELALQLLRADRIAGKEHLLFAAKNAVGSFDGKDRRAKHLSMEFLLFASGEHQIIEAVKLLGVSSSTTELVVTGLCKTRPDLDLLSTEVAKMVNGVPDDSVIDFQEPKKIIGLKKAFKISDKEMDSALVPGETKETVLKRLVIERSALLALEN